jgi:SOS response regulatory protein OraA/RecX
MRTIRRELLGKGIDKALLAQCIEAHTSLPDTVSEKNLARVAVQKKLRLWHTLPILEKKKKIYGFLGRRGFDGQTIAKIIDEIQGKDYNTSMEYGGEDI